MGANFLTLLLVITLRYLGHKEISIGWTVGALFIHEFGHYLGMLITGSKTASISVGVFGPLALGAEGLSAGRKAIVSLSGPLLGWGAAVLLVAGMPFVDLPELSAVASALIYVSAINLIPVKPFDGYALVEHLIFLHKPKIRLVYLILVALLLCFFYVKSFYRHDHPAFALFFIVLGMVMFAGAKKEDNMSDMVLRLRREGDADYRMGQYRPETLKRMEFSLNMFDVQDETNLAYLLREVWDRAWEIPSSRSETLIVLVIYALIIFGCSASPVIQRLILQVF